jgi:hypothetical protein
MCDSSEEPETLLRLHDSVSYFPWCPTTPMPDDLVTKVLERLSSLGEIPSTFLSTTTNISASRKNVTYPNGKCMKESGKMVSGMVEGY